MKTRDCKRLSQPTESTNPPIFSLNFNLESEAEDRGARGKKIKNFCKVKMDSRSKEPLSAKQNSINENTFAHTRRIPKSVRNHTQEVEPVPRKAPLHYLPSKIPKRKHKESRTETSTVMKHRYYNDQSTPRPRASFTHSKADVSTSFNSTGRQLIVSSVQTQRLENYLTNERSFEKLRSITEEESEIIMKARKLSQRKIKKKSTTCRSGYETVASKIQSIFSSEQLSKGEESFGIFKESINESVEEEPMSCSIESLYLDESELDSISLKEMRLFEIKSSVPFLKSKLNERSFKDLSARKIQECWRRYRTKALITKHFRKEQQKALITEMFPCVNGFDISGFGEQIQPNLQVVDPLRHHNLHLFKSSDQEENGEDTESPSNYENVIKNLQIKEEKRWAEIPQLVTAYLSKNNSQADTRSLLERIATLSERNREQLFKDAHEEEAYKWDISDDSSISGLDEKELCKYRQLVSQEMANKLIKSRKSMLREREKAESQILDRKLNSNLISQEQYLKEKQGLRERILEERDEIETTKRYLEIGYERARDSLKKIQLDYSRLLRMQGKPLLHCYSQDSFVKTKKNVKSPERQSKEEEEELLLSNRSFINESREIRQMLPSLQSQRSDVSLVSQESSQRVLKRESNTPLHKLGLENQLSDSSEELSLDLDELAELTLEIKIKNLIERLNNRQVIKERLIFAILEDLFLEACKQLQQMDVNFLLIKSPSDFHPNEGVQTDIYTVRHFGARTKELILSGHVSMEVETLATTSRETLRMLRTDSGVRESTVIGSQEFGRIWMVIKQELEFEEVDYNCRQFLEDIAYHHYQSIFDSFVQLLNKEIVYCHPLLPPWKTTTHFQRQPLSATDLEGCVEAAQMRLGQVGNLHCGLLPESISISASEMQMVRESRMEKMLQLEMLEWSEDHVLEEWEASLRLSEGVWEHLVGELLRERVFQ